MIAVMGLHDQKQIIPLISIRRPISRPIYMTFCEAVPRQEMLAGYDNHPEHDIGVEWW